jgi:MFS family permease
VQASTPSASTSEVFETLIPARLDRLPWSRFHWLLVIGLGITWVLDGLEITLMGAISAVLQRPNVLNFSASEIGFISSCYLAGAVIGALIFGHLTDRFGRRKFFFLSLGIYLGGVALTAISWNLASFAVFRFITGTGIGGEYAAVNSAIDELIPARFRGRVDLIVNGSYWLGAAAGAASTVLLLDPHIIAQDIGWRLGFAVGAAIGLIIIYLRKFIPESPRWLLTHGQRDAAEKTVSEVEETVARETGKRLGRPEEPPLKIHVRHRFGLEVMLRPLITQYRTRSILGVSLMIAQAFVYNAILFTYAIVLTRFYGVPADHTGLYLLPFALGNFLGPVVLGHLFDTIGRRPMIAGTFALSGMLLVLTGWLFAAGILTTMTQTALWTVMFFFASPAASSAYLTVSEIFPLEMRALAIAIFYAIGTAAGGIVSPWFFGRLIDSGARIQLTYGYMVAAGLMIAAAVIEMIFGVAAEQKSLEDVAAPLSSA